MDSFTDPRVLLVAAIVAMSSAFINTGSFLMVNEKVNTTATNVAVQQEKIETIKNDQEEIKGYAKDVYQWVQVQKGIEEERNRNDTR